MFDKNELYILLKCIEYAKCFKETSCVYCEIVDNREEYRKKECCKAYCAICKDIDEYVALTSKIEELLK